MNLDKTYSLHHRLRLIREKLGLIQTEFGEKLDVSKSTIINYESGKRIPDALFLIDIIREFNIDPAWLLLGEGGMFREKAMNTDSPGSVEVEVIKMIEHMRIPTVKLALMAEYSRLKQIFKPIIDQFEEQKNVKVKKGKVV
jgi:transcriptional regulator with XRE-family HTH domain